MHTFLLFLSFCFLFLCFVKIGVVFSQSRNENYGGYFTNWNHQSLRDGAGF